MRSTRWLPIVLVVIMAGAAFGQREGRRRGKEPAESLLEQLVRECKLSEKDQVAVKEKIAARDAVLAKWDKDNAEKVQAAEAAAKAARSGEDADAKTKAAAATRELKKARTETAATATEAVLTALTDEQKAVWSEYQLYQSTVGRYRRAELTDEQKAKIKTACTVAAKELAESEGEKKAARTIQGKLRWAIDVLVLTPDQRKTMTTKPQR